MSSLGDIAILIPALYPIAEENRNDRFMLLTKKPVRELFINKSDNLEIFPVDTKGRHRGLLGTILLAFDVRRKIKAMEKAENVKFHIKIADMHNVLRSGLFRFFFGKKDTETAVINKEKNAKKALTGAENKSLAPLKTTFERYCDVFKKLGYIPKKPFKNIFPEKQRHIDYVIGIAPFAKHKGKIYPYEKMEEIIKALNQREMTHIFFFAGKTEQHLLDKWVDKYIHSESIAGQLSFPEELELINDLTLMISMDSANMHLASLTETPVISVWGATHPCTGFYGYGQNPDDAVQIPLECRPCSVFGNKKCKRGDYACLNNITPEMILEKVEKYLK
jgi:ADP-heptose:LPS heptosyltransferase